ncbi:hypothetical protein LTR40_013880, partial [Exophiala xenobiotica]
MANVNGYQGRYQGANDGNISPGAMNGFEHEVSQSGSSPTKSNIPLGPKAMAPQPQAQRQQSLPVPTPSAILNAGNNNPLTMYLSHVSQQQAQAEQDLRDDGLSFATLQQQQNQALATQQAALFGEMPNGHSGLDIAAPTHVPRQNSIGGGYGSNPLTNGTSTTIGGLLAPTNTGLGASR